MTKWWMILALGVLVTACGAAEVGDEPVPETIDDPTPYPGVHAAVIEFAMGHGQLVRGDLVYVAEPRPEAWDQWCAFDAELAPCRALQAMTIDLSAPFDGATRDEIETAVSPFRVEYIDDPASVILPLPQGEMLAPIRNGAGLLAFGRAIEVDGTVYMSLDAHGTGWLLQATPTGDGWEIETIAQWVV